MTPRTILPFSLQKLYILPDSSVSQWPLVKMTDRWLAWRRRYSLTLVCSLKPLTDVASKWHFLLAICSLQGVASISKATATCGIMIKNVLAMVHLQQFTSNSLLAMAILYLIEIRVTSSHLRCLIKAYENLRKIVKTFENWLRYHMIASEIFSMLKLLLQAIASDSNVQSQLNYIQRLCRALWTHLYSCYHCDFLWPHWVIWVQMSQSRPHLDIAHIRGLIFTFHK